MKKLNLLLLGGSRVVGLLERFHVAARKLEVELNSFEDNKPWHAIAAAGVAQTVAAPMFDGPEFTDFIVKYAKDNEIDIVIPFIDKATIAVAVAAPELKKIGVLPLISSLEVCEAMADKARADGVFKELGLHVPASDRFPLLAKPRFGSSGRGIITLHDIEELEFWRAHNKEEDFMIQSCIEGREYSIDAYVDGSGRLLGAVSRVREVVSGGEAMITCTEHNTDALILTEKLLSWEMWRGPITVQVMYDGEQGWILECNPRFGSGATCSIEAGLAMPEWILRERLGLPLPDKKLEWKDGLCMTRARKDYFLWL
jgi:carbamoyl-phosphate synthase large subunit